MLFLGVSSLNNNFLDAWGDLVTLKTVKWRQSPPLIAFPLSPTSVYLFVGDRRWKEGLGVKWMTDAMRDLGRVKSFLCSGRSEPGCFNCRSLPTPFDFVFFFILAFWMSSFSAYTCFFPPSFIVCSSLILSVSYYLLTTTDYVPFFLIPWISLCIFFPLFATLVLYCPTFFSPILCQSFCILLVASFYLSPHMPCVTDVVSRQRPPLLGLMPARLAPLFCWTPGGVRLTSDRIFKKSLGLLWYTQLLNRVVCGWTMKLQKVETVLNIKRYLILFSTCFVISLLTNLIWGVNHCVKKYMSYIKHY